jgi:putative addiction module killer protein
MTYRIETTQVYDKWFSKVKDTTLRIKILARLARIENGHFGDHKHLAGNLYELRFVFGNGIRIYYTKKQRVIVILLVGGDKSSQSKDIKKAKDLLEMED